MSNEIVKRYRVIHFLTTMLAAVIVFAYVVLNICLEKPLALGYEYFDDVEIQKVTDEGEYVVDKKPIIEVNLVRSETNPELNLSEVILTSYTDYANNDYNRYAIQVKGDINYQYPHGYIGFDPDEVDKHSTVNNTVYYYGVDSNGESYNIIDEIGFNNSLDKINVTAGQQNFLLEVGGPNGKYSYHFDRYSKWGWNLWNEAFNNTVTEYHTQEYNAIDIFAVLVKMFDDKKQNCTVSIKNIDLDKYFTIYKGNDKNQYFKLSEIDVNTAYFKIKCTYKTINSSLSASDSLLGKVCHSATFNSSIKDVKTPFYSTSVDYEINRYNLSSIFNEKLNKYVVYIQPKFNNFLQTLNNLSINIVIDIDEFDTENTIEGIDLTAFKNLKINSITVNSSQVNNFYVVGTHKNVSKSTFKTSLNLYNENGGIYV